MDDTLHRFIKQALEQGQTKELIEQELLAQGWEVPVVQTAINDVLSQKSLSAYSVGQVGSVNSTAPIEKQNITPTSSTTLPKKNHLPIIAVALVVILLIAGGGGYWYLNQQGQKQITAVPIQEQETSQTTDTTYVPYKNTDYGFTMNIPLTWSTKDFEVGSYGEQKRVAFGMADQLPQEIFLDGQYVWIKIYPVSSEVDYKDYRYLKSLLGKDDSVAERQLGGLTGIANNEFIAVEHNEKIYEIHLLKDPTTSDYTADSYEIIRSFTFTESN